mmetsp:Transcript_105675/g.209954  ORF Transcript_105675/g.209954 Transcript_105675/m.209954 type:complete len:225 (-) Transcript_105675:383-1057(-)
MLGAGQIPWEGIEDVEMAQDPNRKEGQEARDQFTQETFQPIQVERPVRKCLLKLEVGMFEDPHSQLFQHPFPEENEDGDPAREQTLHKRVLIAIPPPFISMRMHVDVEAPRSISNSVETILNCHSSRHDLSFRIFRRFLLGISCCLCGLFQFLGTRFRSFNRSFGLCLRLLSDLAGFLFGPARCRFGLFLCPPCLSLELLGFLLGFLASRQCLSFELSCLAFCL